MKQPRFGLILAMGVALMSLTVYFLGCGGGSTGGGGGNGPTASKFVVVANTYGPESLSVYKILPDGTLSFQDNVAVSGGEPSMILAHPNKEFVYVASHNGYIHVFSFSVDNGALTEIESSPYDYGSEYINMAITPDGKFLYTTDSYSSETQVFGVDNTTGELNYLESYEVSGSHGIAMHPTGNFLFIGGDTSWSGNGELFAFAIDPATGALTPAPGSPIVSEGTIPDWVWLQTTPDGKYLFGAGNVVGGVWSIDNVTGALTTLEITDVGDGNWEIKNLVITPTLPYLYVAGFDNNSISAYKANEDGSVDNVVSSPFAAGENPKCMAVTEDSKYLYVANYGNKAGDSSIMVYSIDPSTGTPSRIGTYGTAGAHPKHLVVLP